MMHVAPSAGDYHDRINADLLALIPPDAKRVLEIGCGSGALGQAWLRQHPAVDYCSESLRVYFSVGFCRFL